MKAGVKLGIGLSLLAAVIGIRLVTTTPEGVESGIEELERLDAKIASESVSAESSTSDPSGDDSIVSRFSAGMRERLPSSDARSRDGDKLVSCRLGGAAHFMRADDCAIRGGESTVFSRKH